MYQQLEEIKGKTPLKILKELSAAEGITQLDERIFTRFANQVLKLGVRVVCGMVYHEATAPMSIQQYAQYLLKAFAEIKAKEKIEQSV